MKFWRIFSSYKMPQTISRDELKNLIDSKGNYVLIDVRNIDESFIALE